MLLETCLLVAVPLARPAPPSAPPPAPPARSPASDPVTGVWKGNAEGPAEIVGPGGLPVSFWLEREDSEVTGRLAMAGFDPVAVSGSFDAASGALTLNGTARGIAFAVEVAVEGERLTGEMSALAMEFTVEARRIALEVLAEPPPRNAPADLKALSDEDWGEDVRFLGAYLPQVHADAYHTLSAEEWSAAVEALAARLDGLDPQQRTVALAQLVARVGDAHTGLSWREVGSFAAAPVELRMFADGLFVTGVDERWGDALALRVLEVGTVPASDALAAVSTLFAAENDSWRRAQAPGMLVLPELLAILGLAESRDTLRLVVEPAPGERLELALPAGPRQAWLQAPDPNYDPLPLWRTRTGQRYWFTTLGDERAVYFAYNSCSEDPGRPMAGFVDEVLAAVDASQAERLVIDLRNNSGGNSSILSDQIPKLAAHPRLAGRLAALIGPVTYSSGMMNAHQLREDGGATLLGEPTGGKPNSYGEVRSFRLPRSGLLVNHSTKYFRMLEEDPPAVEPDVRVELTAQDWFAGHDAVLERALALEPGGR